MQSQSLTIRTDTRTQKEVEEEKSEKTQIFIIIMRAFESFCSPYLTDTWDGAAGNGAADAPYSRQAWIHMQRTPTREDDHLLKNKSATRSAANATGSQIKYRLVTQAS